MNINKWVKIYYDLIENLKIKGRPFGPYNSLVINKYYINEQIENCVWKYSRHHLAEIEISGAKLKNLPGYQSGDAIIVDLIEHCLLHYLIVMAKTTSPNHGMVLMFKKTENPIATWEYYIKEGCKKFNITFDENWRQNLTIPTFWDNLGDDL